MQTLDYDLWLPNVIPVGTNDLLLNLPDDLAPLAQLPAYSILSANDGGVQETATGYNDLKHQITISANVGTADCGSNISFGSMSDTPSESTFLPLITAENNSTQTHQTKRVSQIWNTLSKNR